MISMTEKRMVYKKHADENRASHVFHTKEGLVGSRATIAVGPRRALACEEQRERQCTASYAASQQGVLTLCALVLLAGLICSAEAAADCFVEVRVSVSIGGVSQTRDDSSTSPDCLDDVMSAASLANAPGRLAALSTPILLLWVAASAPSFTDSGAGVVDRNHNHKITRHHHSGGVQSLPPGTPVQLVAELWTTGTATVRRGTAVFPVPVVASGISVDFGGRFSGNSGPNDFFGVHFWILLMALNYHLITFLHRNLHEGQ